MLFYILFTITAATRIVSGDDDLHGNEIQSDPVYQNIISKYQKTVNFSENEFSEKNGEIAQGRSFDLNNLTTSLANLVDSYFIFKALLIYWIHLGFQTIGWYLTSIVWNIGRGGAVDLDPDFSGAISEGLLDSDFAATNLALGAGQFMFYFLVWSAVITYGRITSAASSSSKSYPEESSFLPSLWPDEYPAEAKTDLNLTNNQIGAALDDLFSPATITKQFVINILGAVGGTVFVTLMSFLPEISTGRKRRETRRKKDVTFKIGSILDKLNYDKF